MKNILQLLILLTPIFGYCQSGSEIILFDLKVTNDKVVISSGVNITNHKGYDNQPFFHPGKPVIYYSSFDDSSRSDLKYYDYKNGSTVSLTKTREREYSPTVTPDGKFISCIIQRDNGVQDLCKYPINGGQPEIIINSLKVGYHAWIDSDKVLLFVLTDSNQNKLTCCSHLQNDGKLIDIVETDIAKNIGRSLHKIPGRHAMSYVQKNTDTTATIMRLDISTMKSFPVVNTIKGQDHLTWLNNNIILMSDGNTLFYNKIDGHDGWQPVTIKGDATMLKGISRLATNKQNSKLAVVVSE